MHVDLLSFLFPSSLKIQQTSDVSYRNSSQYTYIHIQLKCYRKFFSARQDQLVNILPIEYAVHRLMPFIPPLSSKLKMIITQFPLFALPASHLVLPSNFKRSIHLYLILQIEEHDTTTIQIFNIMLRKIVSNDHNEQCNTRYSQLFKYN